MSYKAEKREGHNGEYDFKLPPKYVDRKCPHPKKEELLFRKEGEDSGGLHKVVRGKLDEVGSGEFFCILARRGNFVCEVKEKCVYSDGKMHTENATPEEREYLKK